MKEKNKERLEEFGLEFNLVRGAKSQIDEKDETLSNEIKELMPEKKEIKNK